MKKVIIAAAIALLGMVAQAEAACTVEEAQAKATELQELVMAKAQSDPNKVMEVSQEMQTRAATLGDDMDALCGFYDEMIAKLK